MTQERNRIRAELQALIEVETDLAKWIAMKDFLEALDDVDDFERLNGGEPVPHGPVATEPVEKPERLPTDDGDITAERFSDNPIDRIFDPPALTTEQLRAIGASPPYEKPGTLGSLGQGNGRSDGDDPPVDSREGRALRERRMRIIGEMEAVLAALGSAGDLVEALRHTVEFDESRRPCWVGEPPPGARHPRQALGPHPLSWASPPSFATLIVTPVAERSKVRVQQSGHK